MLSKSFRIKLWNLWPPFVGAGISIHYVSDDYRHIIAKLKKRWWTLNYRGTQFGGSMFALTDPFYMVMLIEILGAEYSVWDKFGSIQYIKPGRTELTAEFILKDDDLLGIHKTLEFSDKTDWKFTVEIKDVEGLVVAFVEKIIYIRKKRKE